MNPPSRAPPPATDPRFDAARRCVEFACRGDGTEPSGHLFPNHRVGMNVATEDWWAGAACREQDASSFFAPAYFEKRAEKAAREAVAKGFCRQCPVIEACLEFALRMRDPHGVWGGLNEMERRRLVRLRAGELEPRAS